MLACLTKKESLGVVIIGRNEGERLRRCLASVVGRVSYVVYVDSGSSDGSAELAKAMQATVVDLDMKTPFTAARGRNAGFACLMEIAPDLEYVQFVDGDCELVPGWFETAESFLKNNERYAITCGRLRERFPESSIYNRLCDIEWNGPVGDISACGGIFMIRAQVFNAVGGMNSSIVAGEEPEMCLRLREMGWMISRIDQEMAWHDANMTRFLQWWQRAVRSGYGAFDVTKRTNGKVFAAQVNRARLWTLGWGLAVVGLFLLSYFMVNKRWAVIVVLSLVTLYLAQIIRIARKMIRNGTGWKIAVFYGGLMMLSKWAEMYGQIDCQLSSKKPVSTT